MPKQFADDFPDEGSHLERYAQTLRGVEINSSFYRPHQAKTYRRWSEETPAEFQFAVKMTSQFTHDQRLAVSRSELAEWLLPVSELGDKLGALLVQLPPSLDFDKKTAETFFANLRREFDGLVALEPRHVAWTKPSVLKLLDRYTITKVEADPERCPVPETEIRKKQARYLRLHGYPKMYKSDYSQEYLEAWAQEFAAHPSPKSWIIFDNTTYGFATRNAVELQALIDFQDAIVGSPVSSSSRRLSRRKAGATTNMVPTVTKQTTAPKTAD